MSMVCPVVCTIIHSCTIQLSCGIRVQTEAGHFFENGCLEQLVLCCQGKCLNARFMTAECKLLRHTAVSAFTCIHLPCLFTEL